MANYYQNADGTTSTKLKGKNFVQQNDGTTIESGINNINVKSKKKQKKDSFSTAINKLGDVVDNSSVKNRGLSFSNAVTDLANLYDASKNVVKSTPIIGNIVAGGEEVGKTAYNTFMNVSEGAMRNGEDVLDTGVNLVQKVGNVSDNISNNLEYNLNSAFKGKKYAKEVLDKRKKEQAKLKKSVREYIQRDKVQDFKDAVGYSDIQSNLEKDSLVTQENLGGQIAQAIGGMLPSIAVGKMTGAPEIASTSTKGLKGISKIKTIGKNMAKKSVSNIGGNTILAASSYGNALREAYNDGATEEEATVYAIGSSAKEIATEWITGGIPGLNGKGGLDKPVGKLIDKATGKLKNKYGKAIAKSLMDYGYKFIGEGVEEGISEFITPYLKNATYSNDEKVNWTDVLTSFIVGGISGGILDLPGTASNLKSTISDIKNSSQITNATLPTGAKNISVENVEENPLLKNTQAQLPVDSNSIAKMQTVNNNFDGDNTHENNIMSQNILDKNVYNETNLTFDDSHSQFQYTKSDNPKIDNLRKSANTFLNNSELTKSVIETVENVISDKGYNITFDNSLGDGVNGRITTNKNGEVDIRLNPNSDRTAEFVLTHEITHAIETDEMKNLVMDYASKNEEFNDALESLKKIYGTEDVSSEVLADVSGQLFGNTEFINNLSISKPSIFKKIYNKIVEIANKITGNSKESLFVKNLKNKWEEAYRKSNNAELTKEYYSLFNKQNKKSDETLQLSDELIDDIQEKTKENIKDEKNVKIVPIEKILPLIKNGGYRTNEEIQKLTSSIMANGIENPIEIAIDENGKKDLYNGNHRLLVAKKIGLKEVPIKYETSSYLENNVNLDYNSDINNFYEGEDDGSFARVKKSEKSIDSSKSNTRYSLTDSKQLENQQGVSRNGGLFEPLLRHNDGTSSNTAFEKNDISKNSTKGLEDSSFSFDEKAKKYNDLNETNKIEFYTKDNGDIHITLLDSNSNLVNEFTVFSEKDLKKQLGDSIGEYINSKSTSNINSINLEANMNSVADNEDYRINHRPSEDYGSASDFERNMADIFEHPEWYLDMTEPYNIESLNALRKVRNNPEGKLKIYRATPGDEINPGDWVTPSKKYAKEHLERSLNGKGKILEMTVKAKDVLFAGDDINEFGYFPENEKYSKKNGSWQEFVERNFKSKGTRTNFENTRLNINNTEKNLINKETEKITKKYEREKNKNKKIITKEASKILEFDDYQQKRKFTNLVSEYYDNPDLNKIKQDIKDNFSEKRIEYVNDYVKDIKKVIRETDLQITDYVRKNLTDFGNFRKENFNKLKLKNQGQSIDSFYNELSEDYPSVFSKNITNEVDQLERLSEFMNEDDKFYEKYNLDDNVINEAAQYVYDSIKNKDNIDDLINSISISPKQIRKEKTVEYKEYAEKFVNNSDDWIDKKIGLSYKTNTMKRNFYDSMGKKDGERIYHNYIEPIFNHNAQMQNDISLYNKKIAKLKLNDKESTAVQMFGEYKYNPETLVTGMEIDEFITKNKLDHEKIENAVEVFRSTYDELIERVNETLKSQGYKEIDYRKGYFPHFVEEGAKTKFGKILEKMGWKFKDDSVPTDIAGITDIFKPGKVWNRNAQQRKGKYTDFNALKGFDNYVRGAMETIYFTEDIQKLRALENEIRYQHSEKGVQTQIDEILSDNSIDFDERQEKIDKIFTKYRTPLNNLVSEIRDYTNSIANKKSILDRTMEQATNRKVYSVMQNISSRLSANMVGLNLSSAITNFIPITQAASQVKSKYLLKGLRESIKSQAVADNFESKSVFLTSRLNEADRLYKTRLEKFSEQANFMFDGIDSITANTIVRGKYYENIASGMSEYTAMRNADEFARDLMAGRTKGEMPTIFNSKNPLIKLFTSFQLEVNNQYQYMFKDLPRDLADEGKNKLIAAFAKMFFGAWIYNQLTEKVVGRKAAFSPADTIKEIYDTSTDNNLKITDKSSKILSNLTQDVPFVGSLIGGGRLPISSVANPLNIIKGESTVGDETKKLLYYTVLPFGGGQAKKTIEGASMYANDKKIKGSYTSKGQLRFEAEKNPAAVAQALLFGQYASKNARQYFDNSYSPLTDKQLKEVEKMEISVSKYRKYQDDKKEINKIKSDKDLNGKSINGSAAGKKAYLIMNSNFSKKEKNYLLSKIGNSKVSVKVDDLEQLPNDKKIYKFYFGLNKDSKKDFINEIKNYNVDPEDLYNYYFKRQSLRREYTSGFAKKEMVEYIKNSKFDEKTKWYLYNKDYGSDISELLVNTFGIKTDDYFNTMEYANKIAKDYPNTKQANIRKRKVFEYINNLKCSQKQKIVLFSRAGYSTSEFKNSMYTYIKGLKLTQSEKEKIWNSLY